MLAVRPTKNTTHGPSRLKPSDLPNAVAHTASNNPESTRTTQDDTPFVGRLVPLRVRRPSSGSLVGKLCPHPRTNGVGAAMSVESSPTCRPAQSSRSPSSLARRTAA